MDLIFYFLFVYFFVFAILPCLFLAALWSPVGLAPLYVMFSCFVLSFSHTVSGAGVALIVSIPDLCILSYFKYLSHVRKNLA